MALVCADASAGHNARHIAATINRGNVRMPNPPRAADSTRRLESEYSAARAGGTARVFQAARRTVASGSKSPNRREAPQQFAYGLAYRPVGQRGHNSHASDQLSALSCQLSALSCQLSAIG